MKPGAWRTGGGVDFALFSEHAEAVELCLFDDAGAERRLSLARSGDLWHCHVPALRPGQLYGYRVHGPWRPADGHRFNPQKLLIDPYARALDRVVRWHESWGEPQSADAAPDPRDSGPAMAKARVEDGAFDWGNDRPPGVPWSETVILELHVRGFTMQHPEVAPKERGTFAGLASEPAIAYLKGLGVTAVELMPVHAFVDDRVLARRGLVNYWGYNSIAFFAPEPRFLATGAIAEAKRAVQGLHQAGIEVLLDVVFNHSGESDHLGPTLSFRGIDNAAYYRLRDDRRLYVNDAGTGNTLDFDHPHVRQLALDSLRYWVEEMHVDGFRFDLAPVLARAGGQFRPDAPFLRAVADDPVLAKVKLIAEPWDVGPHGYQLGHFPPPWAEWNGRYRDTVRRFWRGDHGQRPDLASRLAGSADLFARNGRGPSASINYVTCHDGFTLQVLVTYAKKHNLANGEGNRDGSDAEESSNYGVEGPSGDPAIAALRERQKRNFLATLFLSLGVPMLLMGDERGRTQHGNNNPYSQDGPVSWLDWRTEDKPLTHLVRALVALRRRHPALAAARFPTGAPRASGLKDLAWFAPGGREIVGDDWHDQEARCLGFVLADEPVGGSLLVLMNAGDGPVTFRIPRLAVAVRWRLVIDTAKADGAGPQRLLSGGETFSLDRKSMAVLSAAEEDDATPP